MSSEKRSDFQICFSLCFPMQSRQARSDPPLGIVIPNSSSAWILLWLFLQLDLLCVLFDIVSRLLMEVKWLMLNKHKRWFHSSRVKFPIVRMSASWFLESMYLIWILGSKLILSNNQSRATLWVAEPCLIVGHLPFMIILITASLSSKGYNEASLRQEFTFEKIKSVLFRSSIFPWIFFRVGDLYGIRVSVKNCDYQIP